MQSVPAKRDALFSGNAMADDQDNLALLNKLIAERENHFQHALSEAADHHLLFHLKKDLDFLKEKREELKKTLNNSSTGGK